VQDYDEFLEGIMFAYPVDQAVLFTFFGKTMTGKVLGQAPDKGVYIVLLDQTLPDAKALLVHEDDMRLLTCRHCQDSQRVTVTGWTGEQAGWTAPGVWDGPNTIPTKPCPYCTEKEVTCG
jgi:hypothetical protein